jgi:hypothetical protein
MVKGVDLEEFVEIATLVDKAFNQEQLVRAILNVTAREDTEFQKDDLRAVSVDGKNVSMAVQI